MFVLIHSPLVGPLTWAVVAGELKRRNVESIVPSLIDVEGTEQPYWKQHVEAVARSLESVPVDRPLILVGHSGAGPLLPAIREIASRPVAAYVFVDAGIPKHGASRLDLIASESPEFAERFQQELAKGGCFPTWSDEDLRDIIPDARLRQGVLAELHPRPLAFFEEPIPVFEGWPDAPCGYLKFSLFYDLPADRARREGWAYCELDAGHFHMLVDPSAVVTALMDLAKQMGVVAYREGKG